MAVTRKSGNNSPNPYISKSGWPGSKPVRRRAPLHVNQINSTANPGQTVVKPELPLSSRQPAPSKKRVPISSPSPRARANFPEKTAKSQQKIPLMPTLEEVPFWLKKIQQIQRYSSLMTFGLVSATLAVYALNVYSQQSWGMAYQELQRLQKHEQQLTTKNEVLKNQIIREAEKPSTGLVTPTPATAIFIPSAVSGTSSGNNFNQPTEEQPHNFRNQTTPMGY